MKTKILAVLCLLSAASARASHFDALTPDQQKAVQAGEAVYVSESVAGAPWPRAVVFQRIESTPEEAAAVFTDYELGSTYMPGMLSAKISSRLDPSTTQIDYVVHVPILKDERNTLEDRISMTDPGTYQVDWHQIRGIYMRSIVGTASFEKLGAATFMAYSSLLAPSSSLPGMEGKALSQVRASAAAVVRQIETEHKDGSSLLQKQIAQLRLALGQSVLATQSR